jgi:heparin binding hemagglutinin HbhA
MTQSKPKTNRIPAPLYAAAGAGDLAYQQLRRLPAVVTDLRGKAAAPGKRSLRRTDLEMERLRETAVRNAAALVSRTHAAQQRALEAYARLVARGERIVGTGVVQAADTVNADMEATEAPAEVTAGSTAASPASNAATPASNAATPASNAATPAAKPAKAKRTPPASAE